MGRANLMGAKLNVAVLKNVDLECVNSTYADLRDVIFSGSVMVDADFTEADIRGTNFANTNTRGCIGLYLDDD